MSVTRIYSIFCDGEGCLRWIAETDRGVADARKIAKRAGWTRRHGVEVQLDLCPECSRRLLKPSPTRGGRPRKVSP